MFELEKLIGKKKGNRRTDLLGADGFSGGGERFLGSHGMKMKRAFSS